jgi:hypothetical protein
LLKLILVLIASLRIPAIAPHAQATISAALILHSTYRLTIDVDRAVLIGLDLMATPSAYPVPRLDCTGARIKRHVAHSKTSPISPARSCLSVSFK